ncbi:MFS transporter [Ornithinibacillus californiensis]|uniref:MFS transporter n=1 Tax=Ornithinibacillus californiensis TaxID=161536 RepID=UPI00064D895D|nr:MFS transporter [Ornithinibacillus californiensis]
MNFMSIHPTIRLRLFLVFISTVSTMTVIPYLIIYFAGQLGNVITGVLFLAVMIANIVGSFIGGYTSDRIGRKKIILISELAIMVGFIGAAITNSPLGSYPYLTFLFFLVIQFSNGAVNPVYQAFIIDISSPEERKVIYTYSYWIRNVAVAIGSMIGAFLFLNYLFFLLLTVAGTSLLSVVLIFIYVQETYTPVIESSKQKTTNNKHVFQSYKRILTHRFFIVFSIASLLVVSIEEQLTNYIGVRLANEIDDPIPLVSLNVDGVNLLGILKGENTLLVVFFTLVITHVIRKWRENHVLLFGLFIYFFGYTILSINLSPIILIVAMFIATIGEIMYSPIMQTMLANLVPDNARSTYMAVYAIATILGVSSAGIFMIISNWVPPLLLTSIFAVMGLISIVLFYRLMKPNQLTEQSHTG